MNSDLRLSQLLCSRLCHDLAGAAGAVSAGIELLNEDQNNISAPLELMEKSAEQITRRLTFFRLAFGSAGGEDSPMSGEDLRELVEAYLAEKKIQITWNTLRFEGTAPALQSLSGKLLANLMLIANDCLPRGGHIQAHAAPLDRGMGIAVEARGVNVRVSEDLNRALNAETVGDFLTARNVHAYFAKELAKAGGGALEVAESSETVQIACVLVK